MLLGYKASIQETLCVWPFSHSTGGYIPTSGNGTGWGEWWVMQVNGTIRQRDSGNHRSRKARDMIGERDLELSSQHWKTGGGLTSSGPGLPQAVMLKTWQYSVTSGVAAVAVSDAWQREISTRTSWPNVGIFWQGEMVIFISNLYRSQCGSTWNCLRRLVSLTLVCRAPDRTTIGILICKTVVYMSLFCSMLWRAASRELVCKTVVRLFYSV